MSVPMWRLGNLGLMVVAWLLIVTLIAAGVVVVASLSAAQVLA